MLFSLCSIHSFAFSHLLLCFADASESMSPIWTFQHKSPSTHEVSSGLSYSISLRIFLSDSSVRSPFGGGGIGQKKEELVLPQIKATNFLFFWSTPPPLGNSVRSMSATLATLRCLCDVCYCDVARDVTVSSYILSLNKNTSSA